MFNYNVLRSNKVLFAILSAGLAIPLGACSVTSTIEPTSIELKDNQMMIITGAITYREKIAIQPGSTATIQLSDVSIMDISSPVLATQTIELNGEQVPIPFKLSVPRNDFHEGMSYSVSARITDPSGNLAWTTDTIHPIDVIAPSNDMGMLRMKTVLLAPPRHSLHLKDQNGWWKISIAAASLIVLIPP